MLGAAVLVAAVSTGAAVAVALHHRAGRLLDLASGGRGHALVGPVLDRYLDEGGPSGVLGRPVSDERPASPGPSTPLGADREVAFEFGTIYLDSAAGTTKIILADDAV
jgi:uncharacterized protein with LGFP repeats